MSTSQRGRGNAQRKPTARSRNWASKMQNSSKPSTSSKPKRDNFVSASIAPQTGCAWQRIPGETRVVAHEGLAARFLHSWLKAVTGPPLLEEDAIYRVIVSCTPTHDGRMWVTDSLQLEDGRPSAVGDALPMFPSGMFHAGKKMGFELTLNSPSHPGVQMQNLKHVYAYAIAWKGAVSAGFSIHVHEVWVERRSYRVEGPMRNLITIDAFNDADDM